MSPLSDDAEAYIRKHRRRQERWDAVQLYAKLIGSLALLCVALFVGYNGCKANDDDVLHAIKAQGLTDPDLGGANPGTCAESESSRRFTATNVQNQRVSGTVCCGQLMKGCTIRW